MLTIHYIVIYPKLTLTSRYQNDSFTFWMFILWKKKMAFELISLKLSA